MNPFELLPVINNVPCKIESIDIWGNNIYIGTNDGQILLYIIEKVEQNKKVSFKSRMEKKRSLGHGKKPVEKLLIISDIGKLLTLCDGNLDVFNLYNLEPTTPIGVASKGVVSFCLKKNSPDYRLCVLSKRKLSFFEYVRVFEPYKEIVLQDTPMVMEWCQNTLCLGYRKEYAILDIDKESHRILFPLDRSLPRPKLVMDAAGKPLFLLPTEDLAVPIDLTGEVVQGSINWSSPPNCLAVWTPYLIALTSTSKSIEIHDLTNQKLVQQITKLPHPLPFAFTAIAEGRADGRDLLMLASHTPHAIFCLYVSNFDAMIQSLIAKGEHEDAIRLFDIFFKKERAVYDENYDPAVEIAAQKARLAKIYEQAGMNELHQMKFEPAFRYFSHSQLEVRSLVSLFPLLVPSLSTFQSPLNLSIPELIANSDSTAVRKIELIDEAKQRLLQTIEKRYPNIKSTDEMRDLTTVMVKLYADFNELEKLADLLSRPNLSLYQQELEEWLTQERYYTALGMLFQYTEKYRRALMQWARLASNELTDVHSTKNKGIREAIDLLSASKGIEPPKELIWEFTPALLKSNPTEAIEIFLAHRRDPLDSGEVIEFLQKNGQTKELSRFLEFLIFEENDKTEHYHTKLAMRYIDSMIFKEPAYFAKTLDDPNIVSTTSADRHKLMRLLEFSNCYHVPTLLVRLKNSYLYDELVILYLRSAQYEQMFDIIVYKLNDMAKAELICDQFDPAHSLSIAAVTSTNNSPILTSANSNNNINKNNQQPQHPNNNQTPPTPSNNNNSNSLKTELYEPKRTELFLCLLKTYLGRLTTNGNAKGEGGSILPQYLIDFLNKFYYEMDPIKVMQLLPSGVPLHTIESYLEKSFNHSISNQRETKIVKNLQKSLHMQTKYEHQSISSNSVAVNSESRCPVCSKPIGDRVFAYFPNGVIVHFKCFQHSHICPISAHNFKNDPINPVSV